MNGNLFEADLPDVPLAPGAVVLAGFARPMAVPLVAALRQIVDAAPFRHMVTPSGHRMSVGMTNCGPAGWVSDRTGYRYDEVDPESGRTWPPMPDVFRELAVQAAARAGFGGFVPDACLINRYEPGARLSLHQDRNERDLEAPIVSVSLGLPAVGDAPRRSDPPRAAEPRRRGRLGRCGEAPLSRGAAAEGGTASADRRLPHQSDVSTSGLTRVRHFGGVTPLNHLYPSSRMLNTLSVFPS